MIWVFPLKNACTKSRSGSSISERNKGNRLHNILGAKNFQDDVCGLYIFLTNPVLPDIIPSTT